MANKNVNEAMDNTKRKGIISYFDGLFGVDPDDVKNIDSITAPSPELEKFIQQKKEASEQGDNTFFSDFGATGYATYIQTLEKNKCEKLKLYRQMERFPYIDDALDEILSEAINKDDEGNEITLAFRKDKKFNGNQKINLQKEFDKLFITVMNIPENYYVWLREFIVTGEFLLENVVKTDDKGKVKNDKRGIRKVKFYQAESYTIEWNMDGKIENFLMKDPYNERQRIIAPNTPLLSYINTGKYDYYNQTNSKADGVGMGSRTNLALQKTKMVLSTLEKVKKVYRQLDVLEDSVVIYRLARAPERLVFNVNTGGLPKNKAEQYMQKLISKYRKKKIYNSNTGEVDQGQNVRCIALDTNIPLLDGRTLKLEDLIMEYKEGKKNWVYSVNPESGKCVPGEIEWAGETRKDAKVLEITLDNDKKLVLTPDHKCYKKDLTKVRADELVVGDSMLPPLYRKTDHQFENFSDTLVCNHKIISIKVLSETQDTGCITVKGWHNFAVGAGIIIQNSILNDFWFPKDAEGRGTDVTSVASGQNLGEMTDVVYFLNKLYRAFKIPYTRVPVGEGSRDSSSFNNGQIGSVTRDEIKFEKFVRRMVDRFLNALKQTFITHLKMKGLWDQYKMTNYDIELNSVPSMYFTAHKEAERVEAKFAIFNQYSSYIGDLFSKKFILTEILGWDMSQYSKNARWLKQEEEGEEELEGGEEQMLGKEEDTDAQGQIIASFGPDGIAQKAEEEKK